MTRLQRLLGLGILVFCVSPLVHALPQSSVTLYASPSGNDHWSGRLPWPNSQNTDGPLATLDGARQAVQAINKAGLQSITVLFREGVYSLPTTVNFGQADSGTPTTKIVYANYPGETPIFSGGIRVQNWTNAGGNKWTATLPQSTQYFENLYYNGERRLRPRLGSYLGTYYPIVNYGYVTDAEAILPQNQYCTVRIAKDVNECFDRFQYNAADPIMATWKNLAPPSPNSCNATNTSSAPVGDIELLDFEQFSTSKLRISCIDATNSIIYLTGPTTYDSINYAQDGFQPGRRYIIENVEDALSEPGQWFLDRSQSPMVLTYLANPGENPNRDLVIVPQASPLVVASDLSYVSFEGLTFEYDNYTVPFAGHPSRELEIDIPPALSFQNVQYVNFDRGTVRHISGTGLEILSCLPADPSQNPPFNMPPYWCVDVSKKVVTANDAVSNSSFYDIGALGMRIGDPWVPAENDNNIPNFISVENNVVEGYSRIIPASFGIGQGMGHDNLYTHNDVYDGYHCAISISQQSGNAVPTGLGNANNTISFNHVFNLLQGIMNDGGSIRIDAGNANYTAPGNKIWNNKIHDVSDASSNNLDPMGYGGNGVYLDNSTGLVDVENNLIYRVSDTAVYTPHGPAAGGEANIVKNNILAYARKAMIGVNDPYADGETTPNKVFDAESNLMYFDRNGNSSGQSFYVQGQCTYTAGIPYLNFQKFGGNLYWRTDGSFASDPDAFHQQTSAGGSSDGCNKVNTSLWTFYTFSQWQTVLNEDADAVVRNPHFLAPFFPIDDYELPFGSPVAGFVPFDPNQAGRVFPLYFPPPVAPTFIINPYNPLTDF